MENNVKINIETLIHFFIEEYFNIPVEQYTDISKDNVNKTYLYWSSPYLDIQTVEKSILKELVISKSIWDNLNIELENKNNDLNNFDSDNDFNYLDSIEEMNNIDITDEHKDAYFKLGQQIGFDISGEFYYSIREQVSELDTALLKNGNKSVRKKVMKHYNIRKFYGIPLYSWVLIYSIKNEIENFIDDYIYRIESESGVPLKSPIKLKSHFNDNVKIPLFNQSEFNEEQYSSNESDLYTEQHNEKNSFDLYSDSVDEHINIPEDDFKIRNDVDVTKFNESETIKNNQNNIIQKQLKSDEDNETIKYKNNVNTENTLGETDEDANDISVFDMYGIRDENKDTSVLEDVFTKKRNND